MKNILALSLCLLAFNGHASTPSAPIAAPKSVSYRCDPGFASTPAQPDCSYPQKQRKTALVLHCLFPGFGFGQLYLENYLLGFTHMAFTFWSFYMITGMGRLLDGKVKGFISVQTSERLSCWYGPFALVLAVGNLVSLGWWIAQAVFIGRGTWTINGYVPYTDGNGVPLTGY